MAKRRILEPVKGTMGKARKVGYLVVHKACGTKFWRTAADLKKKEKCGVCEEEDVVLQKVMA